MGADSGAERSERRRVQPAANGPRPVGERLSLRQKLLLIVAVPVTVTVLIFALLSEARRGSEAALAQALAWSFHARVACSLGARAMEVVDGVERYCASGAPSDHDALEGSIAALQAARTTSREMAGAFSREEQEEEEEVYATLGEAIDLAQEARETRSSSAATLLRELYETKLTPMINDRIADEETGAR